MGFFDSITPGQGSLISGGLGFLGGLLTNDANASRADESNQWSAEQYAKRYQTMTADLKEAGLNPMLAYSQSPGSAPTAQQVTFQNPMSAATTGYQQVGSAQQAHAEVEKIKHVNEQIDSTIEQIKEATKKIPLERDQIRYAIQLLAEQAANFAQDTQNKTVLEKHLKAMVDKTRAETHLLNNQVEVEDALDNIGRSAKEMKPLVDMLRSFFPTYHFGGRIR